MESSVCVDHSSVDPEHRRWQLALAFGLTTLAGLATALGALVPIFVNHTKPKYLASALSFAAGVMLYVSFVEIMRKSQEYLACTSEHSALGAVGCFFFGVIGTALLHLFVHKLEEFPLARSVKGLIRKVTSKRMSRKKSMMLTLSTSTTAMPHYGVVLGGEESKGDHDADGLLYELEEDEEDDPLLVKGGGTQDEKEQLRKMGIMTAVAIGLHNFPEGMAAFVATLSATKLGLAVAFAVAIHNIPEGVCVSMPLYYATGSKTKAIFWAVVSGISEPIGALACYLLFQDGFNTVVYGVLFGMIAGMMVFITLKELLPTAHKYDTADTIVTPFIFLGMGVMGGSLLLFEYSGAP